MGRFIFIILTFFLVLVLELSLVPAFFKGTLPLSFLFAASASVVFPRFAMLLFLLIAGVASEFLYPGISGFFIILFAATALAVFSVRTLFWGEGAVEKAATLVAGAFSFQLFPPFILGFLGAPGGVGEYSLAAAIGRAFTGSDFFLSIIFVCAVGLFLFLSSRRGAFPHISHV